ncbi:MAG: galactose-1-epimerase, partial [Pseudomonadota bacterium]
FQTLRQLEFMELDHNFCLDQARGPLRHAARLASARSGVALDVSTTEPGVQVYTADHVPQRTTGLDGISYGPRSGIALETQVWPDAPNRIDFPSAVLRPGEPLKQVTRLAFKRARRS